MKKQQGFAGVPVLIFAFLGLLITGVWIFLEQQPEFEKFPHKDPSQIQNYPPNNPINSVEATSTWKTYRNEEYGFEFQYPSDAVLKTSGIAVGGVDGRPQDTVGVYRNNGYFTICSREHPCGTPDSGENRIVGYVTIDGQRYVTEGYQSEDSENPIASMFIIFPEFTIHYGYRPETSATLTKEEKAEGASLGLQIIKSLKFTPELTQQTIDKSKLNDFLLVRMFGSTDHDSWEKAACSPTQIPIYYYWIKDVDFDEDSTNEAIVRASSCLTGTAGPDINAVFRQNQSGTIEEIKINRNIYRDSWKNFGLYMKNGKLVEVLPIYKDTDPNCCNTGGIREIVYTYRNGEFFVEKVNELPDEDYSYIERNLQ